MTMKIQNDAGEDIEVFTAEEVTAREAAAVAAKEGEWGKTKAQIEKDRDDAKNALNERTGEIKQFRTLNDATVAKLTVAERTIYENGLRLKEAEDARILSEKTAHENLVNSVLKAKAGTDEKLLKKLQDTYAIIGIDAKTPEEIERKTAMVIGAIKQTEPDLVASIAGFGGGAMPPKPAGQEEKGFADTDKGKAGAAELGLTLEVPKK